MTIVVGRTGGRASDDRLIDPGGPDRSLTSIMIVSVVLRFHQAHVIVTSMRCVLVYIVTFLQS